VGVCPVVDGLSNRFEVDFTIVLVFVPDQVVIVRSGSPRVASG
jgi:phage shock protein PspC (stress-responsive transcriptional regulator)